MDQMVSCFSILVDRVFICEFCKKISFRKCLDITFSRETLFLYLSLYVIKLLQS